MTPLEESPLSRAFVLVPSCSRSMIRGVATDGTRLRQATRLSSPKSYGATGFMGLTGQMGRISRMSPIGPIAEAGARLNDDYTTLTLTRVPTSSIDIVG